MDSLIDLNACSLLCLGKFSHSVQGTHCNSPPQTFGITFITASPYSSLLFCCKRMGHTNLHPALHSLKSVCKGETAWLLRHSRGRGGPLPALAALWEQGARGAFRTHLQLQKPLLFPFPELVTETV